MFNVVLTMATTNCLLYVLFYDKRNNNNGEKNN